MIDALKPNEWADKATNIVKHGLSVTVSNSLSVYDIQKRRKPKPDVSGHTTNDDDGSHPFNDDLNF